MTAKRILCLSNLKNISGFIFSYTTSANNDFKPILNNWKTWSGIVVQQSGSNYKLSNVNGEYCAYLRDNELDARGLQARKLFKCPGDTSLGTSSYGRNDPMGGHTMTGSASLCSSKTNKVQMPSDLILLGERWSDWHTFMNEIQYEIAASYHLRGHRELGTANEQHFASIHKGNCCFAWVDGHCSVSNYLTTIQGKRFENNHMYCDAANGQWSDDPARKK